MNIERVQAIMENPDEYAIKWLDDIGTAVNSRTFAKKGNIDFNDILQTFRPNKNIVIITTIFDFLIDKVPRKLAHYHIEMTHKIFETHRGVDLTACKVSEIQYKMRTGETWYPFLQDEEGRYVNHVNYRVPEVFTNEYQRIRKEAFKDMIQRKKDEREPKEKILKESKSALIKEIRRDIDAGVYGEYERGLFSRVCREKGIDPNYAAHIK